MGSGESTTRKVSFGVDDEDRVRILRGVKLSEDVLQRMRGVANIAPERTSSSPSSAQKDTGASRSPSPSSRPQQSSQNRPQPSTQSSTSKPDSRTKEEQRRYEQKQKIHKEELAKAAQRQREAAMQEMTKAMNRERQHTRKEAEKTKQLSPDEMEVMAQQLQKKDSQLKALDAFYKEQLAQLEKRNLERYEHSKEQFHQAASKTEANVSARNTDPVCAGLQSQILSCYRENGDQTLRCSDLAKAYMQCINAAKKNLMINHG
ncbi:MICOS complex subunit mic25a-like isoform X1 [Seriola dumerili]|uniref:MICOS complex subunit mic25a-like isoform X1 n=1 Tax=Seriola dumerili TaxID=41447 RepID=UPI000BBEE16F|nr:MICOS complex subunit mic25a-like isoform X1 [Seriola dumerili]XP_022613194.1 MICOS complex subunit mic25a-like isoform X1 [Seriola dumerili]